MEMNICPNCGHPLNTHGEHEIRRLREEATKASKLKKKYLAPTSWFERCRFPLMLGSSILYLGIVTLLSGDTIPWVWFFVIFLFFPVTRKIEKHFEKVMRSREEKFESENPEAATAIRKWEEYQDLEFGV